MSADWIVENESRIFSIVQAMTKDKIKALYPKVRFTTVEENINSNTIFPTVYISEMPNGQEAGSVLEGNTIEGIMTTFQVRVITNTSKNDARKVSSFILNAFKDLGFRCVAQPSTTSSDGIHTNLSRYRRMIGYNDKI